MKRFLLTIILSSCVLSSCVSSNYDVKFIDTKSPTDTLYINLKGIIEGANFAGNDTDIVVKTKNAGTSDFPVLVYTLSYRGNEIYASSYPIVLVNYKYVGDYKRTDKSYMRYAKQRLNPKD